MKKKLEIALTEEEWDGLSALHERCWLDNVFQYDKYRIFREKVKSYERQGRMVQSFLRLVRNYDLYLIKDL